MARVTQSRDGKPRMTLRVEHRVGRADLIRLLCHAAGREVDWHEEFPDSPSSEWILRSARETLWHYGGSAGDYWSDDVNDEDRDDIEMWATEAVTRAFPTLGGGR